MSQPRKREAKSDQEAEAPTPVAEPGGESECDLASRVPDGIPRWDALLVRVVEIIGEEIELGVLMGRVAGLVTEVMGADACFVHLLDERRQRLVLAGATPPFDQLVGTIELAVGEGVAGWVARSGRPAVVDDKWHDIRYKYIPELRGEDYASLVSLPLMRPGRPVVGAFNVHSRRPRHYRDEEVRALGAVAGLLAGIVENALLYHQLAARESELARFAVRTIELQELERRRLAAEIHDGISQRVVSLSYHLSAADDLLPPGHEEVGTEITAARALAGAALDEARRAIAGLRPSVLDDLGLAAGLETLARELPDADVVVEADECRLEPHVETALYRIAQEALQNVTKHAGASRVHIEMRQREDGVRLVVTDDGRGFDPKRLTASSAGAGGYGMVSIHERAALIGARVVLKSRPGEGTTVTISLPPVPAEA